jgi:CubicO group peptidase (beta-lactamase class C family)
MLKRSCAAGAALALAFGMSAHAQETPAQLAEQAFAEFDGANQPGCSVGIMRDGELVHAFARGMADIEARKPLDPRTVFNIASVSKQFTAFGLLLLEQRGAISRTDPVTKHVPELGRYARTVTLNHLLHHTGGLRAYDSLLTLEGHALTQRTTREQAIEVLRRQRGANAPPGTEYDYSNTGFFLAGLVIERVSGKSLREFMRDEVFRPLGMVDTEVVDHYPAGIERLARGYSRNEAGFEIDESLWEQTGDGQVHTTVADLARWERNFLTGELGGSALIAKLLETTKLVSGRHVPYAAGVAVGEYRGLPAVRHGGDWAGYRAHYARFPAQRFGVAVLCNRSEVTASRYALTVAEAYLSDRMAPVDVDQKVTDLKTFATRGDPSRLPAGSYRNSQTRNVVELTFDEGRPHLREGEDVAELNEVAPAIFSVGASRGSFAVFIPAAPRAAPRIIVQDSPQQRSYELVPPGQSSPKLTTYLGTYRSAEVNTRFELVIRNGQLALESGGAVLPLRPVVPHEFRGAGLLWEGAPFTLSFGTRPRGRVQLFTEGLRGVQFERTK